MNTFFLKSLAQHIVENGEIDKTEAKKIVSLLSPKDLRSLSEIVSLEEEKATAYVTTADELTKSENETLQAMFKGKKIINKVDKKIGAGIRAEVYDMIYDLSIKSKVQSFAHTLEEEL